MKKIIEFISEYKGAVVGAVIGLILAILMLTIGFWRTLLIFVLIVAGVLIGMALDNKGWVSEKINKYKK